ncbi:hypothetical protein [Hymenobacter guriensis]|uniref:Uncharacterized protein n=1 Tax=Hymenobacter guriensis TaxID=2793065 RepID=A0ABS0L1Z1_9BACT|nr:hypothetical protein [Hymenobacter guriensis]MBG8554131.1 hypothetical protein [Hymenobacter guriensis]
MLVLPFICWGFAVELLLSLPPGPGSSPYFLVLMRTFSITPAAPRSPQPAALSLVLKDSYLKALGFVPLRTDQPVHQLAAAQPLSYVATTDVRYRHPRPAADGTVLYVYAWLHESGYLLATSAHLNREDQILAELTSNDFRQLQRHTLEFFARHGGVAALEPAQAA